MSVMRLVVHCENGMPEWVEASPYKKYATILQGPSRAEVFLQYMIDEYDRPTNTITFFLHEDSPKTMVREDWYGIELATGIISKLEKKNMFKWFWPIGVVGVCDHEGHPHKTKLPIKQIFSIAGLATPSVIPFIMDQSFAVKHDTMTCVDKGVYEDLLASRERFGNDWEACMTRLWLHLYRSSIWTNLKDTKHP